MTNPADVLDQSISAVKRLRESLSKGKGRQVHNRDETSVIKATAYSWFNGARPNLGNLCHQPEFASIESRFRFLAEASERASSRERYLTELMDLKKDLIALRSQALLQPASTGAKIPVPKPDFSKLISDPAMQKIIDRRWAETQRCLEAGAYLAGTVMMGAILEALLLARVNRMPDKAPLFTAKCAPRDKAGKTKSLQEWTLNSYIDVAHELGWIGKPARDIGVVLRDYRNFIHPEKELSQGVSVGEGDCQLFWVILNTLAPQIINS